MDIRELKDRALAFNVELDAKKRAIAPADYGFYPYGTLNNFIHIDALLSGDNRNLKSLIGDRPVLDIGGADGDLAFFMESLGYQVTVIDNAPTNFNGLRGIRQLKQTLQSSVEIFETDLDTQFALPRADYGLVFFLGILYHLKNPFYALEELSRVTRHLLLSTRIARWTPDRKTELWDYPVAYLLHSSEANNDPTNFWIFSDTGLRRLLERTGWEVLDYRTAGNTRDSDPASNERDERAFCLLRSHRSPGPASS